MPTNISDILTRDLSRKYKGGNIEYGVINQVVFF